MGVAGGPREEMGRLPSRSGVDRQARPDGKRRPHQRQGREFVSGADELFVGEVGKVVTPAEAGVHSAAFEMVDRWIRAFAGMTVGLFSPAARGFFVLGARGDPALAPGRLLAL